MKKPIPESRCLLLAGLLLFPLALPSCGDDTKGQAGAFETVSRKTADVAADAGKLIPEGAVVVARFRNVNSLVENAKAVAESFAPGSGAFVDVAPLLAMSGLRPKLVDMDGSPVFALSITEAGQLPQFIVPIKDADAAAGSSKIPNTLSGDYLGMGLEAKPVLASSTPAIGKNLPVADYAIRVDLKALLAQYRPMIEPYLDPTALESLDPSIKENPAALGVVEMMTKATKEFLDDARRLDVALSLDDGALDLDCVFELAGDRPESPSGSGMSLAQMLPMNDAALYMVFESNWADFADTFLPMYDKMTVDLPKEQRDAFLDVIRASKELYAGMKGGGAFALDFAPQGMQSMGLMENEDPATYLKDYMSYIERYSKAIAPLPAEFKVVDFEGSSKVSVDGVDFQGLKMRFDMAAMMKSSGGVELPLEQVKAMSSAMEQMIGKDGVSLYQGAHEKLVLMTIGSGDANATRLVSSVKKGQKHKNTVLEHASARLHDRPSYFIGMDLRRLAQQMHAFTDSITPMSIPAAPAGKPVIVWMSMAATDSGYGFQAHIDLAGIAELMKAMTPR